MAFDKFGWIEKVLASEAPDGAKIVGVRLALKYATAEGEAWPAYPTLAADLSRSVRAVRRGVEGLRDLGFVRWTAGNGQGHSNRYQLLHPASKVDDSVHVEGGQQRPPLVTEGGRERHQRWTSASLKVDASVTEGGQQRPPNHPRTIHESSKEPSTSNGAETTWPDGWTEDHPKVDAYVSVLRRLEARLPKEWDVLKAEGPQVQKLRNAAAKAATEGVDPYRLANIVTAKPLDGLSSYSAGLAKRIEDALPTIAGGGSA